MDLSSFLMTGYATCGTTVDKNTSLGAGFCHASIKLVLHINTPSLMRFIIIHITLVEHLGNLGTLETGRTHAMPSFIEAFVIHISKGISKEKELYDAARFKRVGLALYCKPSPVQWFCMTHMLL